MGQTQSGAPQGAPFEGGASTEASLVLRLAEETPLGAEVEARAAALAAGGAASAAATLFELASATPRTAASEAASYAPTAPASAAAEDTGSAAEGTAAATTTEETDGGEEQGGEIHRELTCCVCFDLLQKPVLLQCGHLFCFWCAYRSMNGYDVSVCPLCRAPFDSLPPVCRPLYLYILKKHPAAAARRDREVELLESQKRLRSPPHHVIARGPPGAATDSLPLSRTTLLLLLRQEAPDLLPIHMAVDLRVAAAASRAEELWAMSRREPRNRAPRGGPTSEAPAGAAAGGSPTAAGEGEEEEELPSDTDEGPLQVGPVWRRVPPPPGLQRHMGDSPAAHMDIEDDDLQSLVTRSSEGRATPVPFLSLPRRHQLQQQPQQMTAQAAAQAGRTPRETPQTGSEETVAATTVPVAATAAGSDAADNERAEGDESRSGVGGDWLLPSDKFVHYGVICHICGKLPIVGPRFKCMDCLAVSVHYDVCGACRGAALVKPARFASQHNNQILQWILMHYQDATPQEGQTLVSSFDD